MLDTNSTVLVTKVGCDGLLTAVAASSLSLVTVGAEEETDLENTRDGLDPVGQLVNLPDAILARAVFAVVDIVFGEKRLEWSVDDVETLVGLDRAGLCENVLAELGLD